jgi:putative tryptophan/tyrosine transport system substrate-binding protein
VFLSVTDPVGSGLVSSLAKPWSNFTGFTDYEDSLGGKWVELLKEISPATARMAMHSSLNYPFVKQFIQSAEAAAARLSVSLTVRNVLDLPELERDIAAFGVEPNGGLVVMADTLAVVNYQRIIQLAHQHHLPAIYPWPFCPRHGGLSSYSYDMISMARAGAGYIDRILRGAKPSELPVQQPTKFNFMLLISH